MKSFVPRRWMTKEGVTAWRSLASAPVGSHIVLEVGFHPRHGLKTKTFTRIA